MQIMRLGFVGTGTIAAAIIEGLCEVDRERSITVSPRNAEVAAGLAERFANVRIAATNQAVLDASDVVFLAVRPQIADGVLRELRFRPDHHAISLIAAVTLDYLKGITAPASSLTRTVPIPSVARRQGPTAFFPPNPTVKALFEPLGTAIELDNESEFHVFTAGTAMMASYFQFAEAIASWMVANGVRREKARLYVGQMLAGLAGNLGAAPDRDFAALAMEHQTHGGLNEQVLDFLSDQGVFSNISLALDVIKERLIKARA
jgi:pyrroline-5-carboxylate reductase